MKRLHMVLSLVLTHIHLEVLRAYSGSTQKSPVARPYAVPELKLRSYIQRLITHCTVSPLSLWLTVVLMLLFMLSSANCRHQNFQFSLKL